MLAVVRQRKWVARLRRRAAQLRAQVELRAPARKVTVEHPAEALRAQRARRMPAVATVLVKQVQQAPKDSRKDKVAAVLRVQRAVRTVPAATHPLRWGVLQDKAAVRRALQERPERLGVTALEMMARWATTEPIPVAAARLHLQAAATATVATAVSKARARTARLAATRVWMASLVTKVRQ